MRTCNRTSPLPACGSATSFSAAHPGDSNTTALISRRSANPRSEASIIVEPHLGSPIAHAVFLPRRLLLLELPRFKESLMPDSVLRIDPRDNVLVALVPLSAGTSVSFGDVSGTVTDNIPIKQKLALVDLNPGDLVIMYGMVVGEATQPIARGGLLSTRNVAIVRATMAPSVILSHSIFPIPPRGSRAPSWAITVPMDR